MQDITHDTGAGTQMVWRELRYDEAPCFTFQKTHTQDLDMQIQLYSSRKE